MSHFYNVLHPEVQILRSIIAAETILMGELIFLEVSMGAKSEKNARPRTKSRSVYFDDNARTLNRRGSWLELSPLARTGHHAAKNTVDLIIGTYCIEHGHQLLHRDRDFDQMQQLGLQVYGG